MNNTLLKKTEYLIVYETTDIQERKLVKGFSNLMTELVIIKDSDKTIVKITNVSI